MKNQNIWKRVSDFVLGKGFYMVMALCLMTVGVSGYYLVRGIHHSFEQPTAQDTEIVLPDPEPLDSVLPEIPELPLPIEAVKPSQVEVPESQSEQQNTESPQTDTNTQVFTWPVKGEVLRPFSIDTLSLDPTLGDWRTHAGVDLAAAMGTRVLAMTSGTVLEIKQDDFMGTCVIVDHGNGLLSTYCNLAQEIPVKAEQPISTGDILGTVGESAMAERELPSHLHLEVSQDGDVVDPISYLPER